MRGVGAVAWVLALPAVFAGCGGRSHRLGTRDGEGGAGALAAAGGGIGAMSAGAGGRASAGATSFGGLGGGEPGAGGAAAANAMPGQEHPGGPLSGPSNAGHGGFAQGGASGGGIGGDASGAGAPGNHCSEAVGTYSAPTREHTWHFEGGDATSAWSPSVLAVDEDVIVAAASNDAATAGLSSFDRGITAETFVMRLSHEGERLWTRPLKAAGLPFEVVRTGDDVLVIAQNSPELAHPDSTFVPKDVYIAKVGIDGTLRYEKTIAIDGGTWAYSLAVEPSGDFYVAGGLPSGDALLVKCDTDANVVWKKTYQGVGAAPFGLAALPSGDLVMTGEFADTLSFDGGTTVLHSLATNPPLFSGFVARLTPDGNAVWSEVFGGGSYAQGFTVAALPDDGFLLAGANALDLELGGQTTHGVPFVATDTAPFPTQQSFIARLDGDGHALWLTLPDDILNGSTDSRGIALATDGTSTALLAGRSQSEKGPAYLRSFDLATGATKQVLNGHSDTLLQSTSVSLAPCGNVWVAGSFATNAQFQDDDTLSASSYTGEYLLWLESE